MLMRPIFACVVSTSLLAPVSAAAEWELSFYIGTQSAPHSDVEGEISDGMGGFTSFSDNVGWEGRPFETPPYYGIRATKWINETTGWGVELNHAKVYADDESLAVLNAQAGITDLEFTDGLNLVTVNYMRRFPDSLSGFLSNLTPYAGAGLGVAIPHVDVSNANSRTFEYQLTGPAAVWMAGASYPISESFSGFVEYKGSYSSNTAELEGGGELETNIITNALNFGLSFNF